MKTRTPLQNDAIADAIMLLEKGQWRDKKEYIKALHKNGECTINGYTFEDKIFAWIVWMPTDIGREPEYKGEPLSKVVPQCLNTKENIKTILAAQAWIYN